MNLCTRAVGRYAGEPARLFARVVERLHPDRAALVTGPGGRALAGFSPELFWSLHEGRVTSSPIKGTAPRAPGETTSPALAASAKDAAENVMIVDLVRHDLAQVSAAGSVEVPELLALRPHPGVWHLVSTVTSRLAPGRDVADLLRATFPPGSVTGAPKAAALAALPALEPAPRGAHTGAVGLVTPTRGAELAVTIRTFELADGHPRAGGGRRDHHRLRAGAGVVRVLAQGRAAGGGRGRTARPGAAPPGAAPDGRPARGRGLRVGAGGGRPAAAAGSAPGPARPVLPRALRPRPARRPPRPRPGGSG